jgi:hypothetical protein
MDGRRAHRAKPVLVTIPEKFSGGGSLWGATRRGNYGCLCREYNLITCTYVSGLALYG